MKAPDRTETQRLVLRRPTRNDVEAIFVRYASDPEVTRYLGWPRHRSIEHTHAFVEFSDAEWTVWPAGAYLIESRVSGVLLGSTGFSFETPQEASTGYVLARDAWGYGYATEALTALMTLCESVGLRRVSALCHHQHAASQHVLEKCGFSRDQTSTRYVGFPNLGNPAPQVVAYYVRKV